MPQFRKLVFTTVDRAISYYEVNRGMYELTGRVYASGLMGVPQTISLITNETGEKVVYGDSKGCVVLVLCGAREWPARDLISTPDHQDYVYLHKEHHDWVTKVEYVPDIGLVTASLDSTIKIYDIYREKVTNTCTHHSKGIHSFVYSRAYSVFASVGLERDVIVWQGNTLRRVGELRGHTASVTHIALDEKLNQVFTLAMDKVIKVWDLRTHRCLQTICDEDWPNTMDAKPHCIMYDNTRRRLVSACQKPYAWVHKLVTQDRTGHMEPVRGALYNKTFCVLVTADEGGTVCVWNVINGAREGRFSNAHENSRLTTICFDKKERRLVTAANNGSVRMWNFNNGSLLREYKHHDEPLEIATVMFAADEKRGADAVYAAGWNCKVFVWEDADEDVVDEYRTYEGHREDIVTMTAFPDRQLLATGDYEGRILLWNLFTGEKRLWLCHRAERYETSVEKLLWLPVRVPGRPCKDDFASNPATPLLLLSGGGDGCVRVWLVGSSGKLLCTLAAAQGRLEQVSSMCCDAQYNHVIIGDSAGHVRVYSVADGVVISSLDACRSSFKQRAHWRAHNAMVTGTDIVPDRNLLVTCSRDAGVSMWTLDGALVGQYGEHTWQLDDVSSWVDNEGLPTPRPVLEDKESLYLQALDEDAGPAEEATSSSVDVEQATTMLLQERQQKRREGIAGGAVGARQQLYRDLRLHELAPVEADVNNALAQIQISNTLDGKKKRGAVAGRRTTSNSGNRAR